MSNNELMKARKPLALRRATSADARAIALVHITSWQSAYRGLLPDAFLDGLDVEKRASLYCFDGPEDPATWIAVEGFVAVSACRDVDANDAGEIHALYVAPDYWRSGAGTLLLNKGESVLAEMGFVEASLWVLEANERARRFYEAVGWRPEERTNMLNLAGIDVTEVRYRRVLKLIVRVRTSRTGNTSRLELSLHRKRGQQRAATVEHGIKGIGVEVRVDEVGELVNASFATSGEVVRRVGHESFACPLCDAAEKRSAPRIVFEQAVPERARGGTDDTALVSEERVAAIDVHASVVNLVSLERRAIL